MKWHWIEEELAEHWLLRAEELQMMAGRTGHGRMGFSVMLKFFQYQGRFPAAVAELPTDVVRFLAAQIGASPTDLEQYDWEGRTAKRQRAEILAFLGIRRITPKQMQVLLSWLHAELLPMDYSLEQLLERVGEWFREQRIEPPGATRLDRLLRSEMHAFETALLERITSQLTPNIRASVDSLLSAEEEGNPSTPTKSDEKETEPDEKEELGFARLRLDPGRASLDSVFQELAKLKRIRELELPTAALSALPPKWAEKFRLRAGAVTIWDLRRHPPTTRYALVAAFCWQRQQEIVDGLIDLLIQIIHKIGTKAETKVEQELLEDLRQVRGKTNVLFKLAEAAVDQPEGVIKEVLYPVVGLQTLEDLVKEFKASGPAFRQTLHTVIRASYRNHYRRMLPPILDALEFRSNNAAHRPVIDALNLLKRHRDSRQRYFTAADEAPHRWRHS